MHYNKKYNKKGVHKKYFSIIPIILFAPIILFGQYKNVLTKTETGKDTVALYQQINKAGYHTQMKSLILLKNSRYKYMEQNPLSRNDSSEGNYRIIKNQLILNSDLQEGNIQVLPKYLKNIPDKPNQLIIRNLNDKPVSLVSFFIDYTMAKHYSLEELDSLLKERIVIKSLKIEFIGHNYCSAWIPLKSSSFLSELIIQTKQPLDDYSQILFINKRFRITNNHLTEQ